MERDIDRLVGAGRFLTEILAGHDPTESALESAPMIQSWMFGAVPTPIYMGRVTGHPAIVSGAVAVTSPVIVSCEEHRWVRTLSRLYRLGTPMRPDA